MIQEEPKHLDQVKDAYLAAVAEHLAYHSGIEIPEWVRGPSRFLKEPFFAGDIEKLKLLLIKESPAAFRRRMLFVSGNALARA